ncbi:MULTISPECIES: Uma2 family endonuclease [unclassified Streptomyces]|uniref:Uma2 family endonuclease n=1 Tax=unclassified Streptomyces TaxID=2593676 RepID=UPI0022B697D1|nr:MULTISPECIES: Uma2 family endonuclease [unclassified Streptomyces]MCZ7413815.1 Uma2 family endonuclease [Streptomyces sp. WMMC897]MCZ7430811.1 Uma2 family endonuclease [Streptomyces sp. WMMC1477]
MSVEPLPSWAIPPPGGFTAEDLLRLPGLPPHTELIDGSLVFVSPQTRWHSRLIGRLWAELDRQAPEHLRAEREMTVKLGPRQAPEPDVIVVYAEAFDQENPATYYVAEDVLLAVEAVSPESEERDRDTKPRKYAQAGIRHYWRFERAEGRTVAYLYELDPASRCYGLTGIHHEQLKTSVPFPFAMDLTSVNARLG